MPPIACALPSRIRTGAGFRGGARPRRAAGGRAASASLCTRIAGFPEEPAARVCARTEARLPALDTSRRSICHHGPRNAPGELCRARLQRRGIPRRLPALHQGADGRRLRGRDGRRRLDRRRWRSPCATPSGSAGAGRAPGEPRPRACPQQRRPRRRGRVPVVRRQRRPAAARRARAAPRRARPHGVRLRDRERPPLRQPPDLAGGVPEAQTFYRRRYRTHVTSFRWLLADRMAQNKLWRRSFWEEHGYASRRASCTRTSRSCCPPTSSPARSTSSPRPSTCTGDREDGEPRSRSAGLELRTLLDRWRPIEQVRSFLAATGRRLAALVRRERRRGGPALPPRRLPDGDDEYRAGVPRRGGRRRARRPRRRGPPARRSSASSGTWCAAAGCRSCSRSCASRRPPCTGGRRR